MRIVIFVLFLLFIFCFGLLFPTMLFLSDERKKKKTETLVKYCVISLLFVLGVGMFAIFYDSMAILETTKCDTLVSFNCMLSDLVPKKIVPSTNIIFIFLIQLLTMIGYSYYTAKKVMEYSVKERAILQLVIFFMVGIVATVVHYYILYDVVFVGELQYIALISANQYGLLPLIYLIIMTIINKNQLKFK